VSDLFAPWTLEPWRDAVLEKIKEPSEDDVIFQLLTKCPAGIPDDSTFHRNIWLGVTVTCQDEVALLEDLIGSGVDIPSEGKFFASFEPLLGSIVLSDDLLESLDWMVIGKLTGSRRVRLEAEWVDHLIECAEIVDVPVFVKNSIVTELGEKYRIQEFPV
jgi:protein gp37